MGGSDDEQMVDNPYYTGLQRLKADVQEEKDTIRAALDKPARDMGSGDVWTGTTADEWGRELEPRKRNTHTKADQLIADIDAELRTHDPKVTLSQARTYNKILSGQMF